METQTIHFRVFPLDCHGLVDHLVGSHDGDSHFGNLHICMLRVRYRVPYMNGLSRFIQENNRLCVFKLQVDSIGRLM